MKIVIFVDYASNKFNKDFQVSNRLVSEGHNVFLAVNSTQFDDLKGKCDRAYLGYSKENCGIDYPLISEIL